MNATAQHEPKMSKQGWPLGKYRHILGWTYRSYYSTLATKVKAKYGLDLEFVPFETGSPQGHLYATARLSMERFAVVRAYIEGFNANS